MRAARPLVQQHGRDVEPVRVVAPAGRVRDGDDLRARLGREPRERAADVAEPLHRDLEALELARRAGAASRRRQNMTPRPVASLAADRAADRERLAGDDAEHRVALVHRERVEDPRHHLRARADVGRRDVALRADLVDDLGRVAARHALELLGRELLRVADDAALGAAEREVHQRALPRHPHRQRLELVERDRGVVADAALRRAARDVVRDAPAGEDAHAAVVHRHRDRDLDRLLARAEDRDEVVVDAERVGHVLQLLLGHLQGARRSSGALDP